MNKIYVVYWSQTGNTQAMAEAVGRGIVDAVISGKQIGLFGSYGWGDGRWMRDWQERVTADGASVIGKEGVIAQEAPDDGVVEACCNLGKALAAAR